MCESFAVSSVSKTMPQSTHAFCLTPFWVQLACVNTCHSLSMCESFVKAFSSKTFPQSLQVVLSKPVCVQVASIKVVSLCSCSQSEHAVKENAHNIIKIVKRVITSFFIISPLK